MSAAMRAGADENGTSAKGTEEVAALLKRALSLLDEANAPPELAARVQAAIDAVEDYRPE